MNKVNFVYDVIKSMVIQAAGCNCMVVTPDFMSIGLYLTITLPPPE